MKINHLTTAEEVLMKVLWQLDSGYMRDVITEYPEPKPHANTISTFLKILVEKEFLSTTKEGRIFRYQVIVPFEEYRNHLLLNFISDYFDGTSKELLPILVRENLVKESDIKGLFDSSNLKSIKEEEDQDESLSDFINDITSSKKDKKKKKKKKSKVNKNKKSED